MVESGSQHPAAGLEDGLGKDGLRIISVIVRPLVLQVANLGEGFITRMMCIFSGKNQESIPKRSLKEKRRRRKRKRASLRSYLVTAQRSDEWKLSTYLDSLELAQTTRTGLPSNGQAGIGYSSESRRQEKN